MSSVRAICTHAQVRHQPHPCHKAKRTCCSLAMRGHIDLDVAEHEQLLVLVDLEGVDTALRAQQGLRRSH